MSNREDEILKKAMKPVMSVRSLALLTLIVIPLAALAVIFILWYVKKNRN